MFNSTHSLTRSRKIVITTSTFALIVSGLVLCGWALDVELFKRLFPRLVAMNPTTAVALILLALSLWLSQSERAGGRAGLIAKLCAGTVALIGLLKLSEVLSGRPVGVDQWLFADKLKLDLSGQPNRMAPNTALNFLLLGSAVLLLNLKFRRGFNIAQACVMVSLCDSLLPMIGYAYGTSMLYGIGHFIPMALHTAITFLALGIGILFASPDRGLIVTILDTGVSGIMTRRILPVVICLPVLIGWLRLEGQRHNLYDNELGVALMVVAHIIILATFVWWNSFLLLGLDTRRKQAEVQLQELTLTDDLTGLRNRRGFLLLTEQELKLARSKRTGIGLWLVYADLDGLKQINDSLGHEFGSRAIVQTAEVLKTTFRETDIIARLGGDEFVVLAVSNEPDSGKIMLARLEANMCVFNQREREVYELSLSAGAWPVDPEKVFSIEEALQGADQAMYEHKRSKNQNRRSQRSWDGKFVKGQPAEEFDG